MGEINPMIDGLIIKAMIATPFMQDFIAAARRRGYVTSLLVMLEARLGSLTPTVRSGLEQVMEEETLERLTDDAVACSTVQEFEECLRSVSFDPITGYPPP